MFVCVCVCVCVLEPIGLGNKVTSYVGAIMASFQSVGARNLSLTQHKMGCQRYLVECEGPDVQTVSLFHTIYLFKIFLHCLKVDVVWCAWIEGEGERGM